MLGFGLGILLLGLFIPKPSYAISCHSRRNFSMIFEAHKNLILYLHATLTNCITQTDAYAKGDNSSFQLEAYAMFTMGYAASQQV